jgi:hypothetical protein
MPAPVGRWSDHSLYSEAHVTFEDDAGAYDQKDAQGFIQLNALRLRPDTGCWSGCQARKACPVGQHHAPDEANGRFHMNSFVGLA